MTESPADDLSAPDPSIPIPPGMEAGPAVEVAPGVRRIVARNPGLMTGPGTNTYLIGAPGGDVAVVDPGPDHRPDDHRPDDHGPDQPDQHDHGPDDDAHLEAICAASDRIRWILVTHTHRDHAPLSARLKAATGAQVLAFGPAPLLRREGLDGHDRDFAPDRLLADGDTLVAGDFRVDAVYTPGHTSNHLCFELAGTGLLFSGDHVMSGSTVVIGPPDGDMTQYMESLTLVRARQPRRIGPGHGPMIDDPAAVLDDYLAHRREREHQVLSALDQDGVTAEQLVERIYVDIPLKLRPVARSSVWAHLRKLRAEGKATTPDPDDIAAPWHANPTT